MSFFHFREKISYRQHSLSRHGVHSPFVFDFIEQVLHNKAGLPDYGTTLSFLPMAIPARHKALIGRVQQYYGCQSFVYSEGGTWHRQVVENSAPQATMQFDTLLMIPPGISSLSDPSITAQITATTIAVVSGMYHTPADKARWESLSTDPAVVLSLDMFETGLLFFREEFLVKQHFRLKF